MSIGMTAQHIQKCGQHCSFFEQGKEHNGVFRSVEDLTASPALQTMLIFPYKDDIAAYPKIQCCVTFQHPRKRTSRFILLRTKCQCHRIPAETQTICVRYPEH